MENMVFPMVDDEEEEEEDGEYGVSHGRRRGMVWQQKAWF